MSAPSETDIREALRLRSVEWPGDDPRPLLHEAVGKWAAFLTGPAFDVLECPDEPPGEADPDGPDDLWRDFRPPEARRAQAIAQEAIAAACERAEAVIIDELTRAGLRFAAEYPDAPRPKPQLSIVD